MISGSGSPRLFRERSEIQGAQGPTTDVLSRRFSGLRVLERHGATFPRVTGTGTRSFSAFDTAGESFELNTSAAQRVGMLTGTVRSIILAQGSVPEKIEPLSFSYILDGQPFSGLLFYNSPKMIRQQYQTRCSLSAAEGEDGYMKRTVSLRKCCLFFVHLAVVLAPGWSFG